MLRLKLRASWGPNYGLLSIAWILTPGPSLALQGLAVQGSIEQVYGIEGPQDSGAHSSNLSPSPESLNPEGFRIYAWCSDRLSIFCVNAASSEWVGA